MPQAAFARAQLCVETGSVSSHWTYRPRLSEGQLVAALKFSDTKMVSRAAYSHGQGEDHAWGPFLLSPAHGQHCPPLDSPLGTQM